MSSVMCTVNKGDLPINISWTLNGRILDSADGVSIMQTNKRISQLSIDSASAEHTGNYTCIAQNLAGSASHTTSLHVNGNVSVEGAACFVVCFYIFARTSF